MISAAIAMACAALLGEPDELVDELVIGPPVEVAPSAVTLDGGYTTHVALRWDPRDDDARSLRVGSTLDLGLTWAPDEALEVALAARVRHHLDVVGQEVAGELAPDVRLALLRWQWRERTLTLGMDIVRWGRTLARPFDLLNPIDWRDGPLGPEGGARVPTFAAALRQRLGDGELSLRWAPFYFAAALPGAGLCEGDACRPPQDVVHSSELAARVTQRFGALDVALGWMWRLSRARVALPVSQPATRQHVVGLEVALATGPLRWLAEAALVTDEPLYDAALARHDETVVRWGLDVAVAPAVFLDVTLGAEGAHSSSAVATYLEGPDDVWLRGRLGLMLAFDGVLRLDLETRVGLLRDDWWVLPTLTLRAADSLTLGLGLAVYGGKRLDLGLGAIYDRADEAWLRATYAL